MSSREPKPVEYSDPKSYEEAMRELEGLLESLESERVDLEESLVKYERGKYLLKWCREVLEQAQKRFEKQEESSEARA